MAPDPTRLGRVKHAILSLIGWMREPAYLVIGWLH